MEITMTPVLMPFTYLSESTARSLTTLLGPVVVYQPLKSAIPSSLDKLSRQGLVEIRTPMTRGDHRLRAALAEFLAWARNHAGKTNPGAGFFSTQQGKIPFFDESAVNRIRSEIKSYHSTPQPSDQSEEEFGVRLFLCLAQENDQASDRLDHDLHRFQALEKDFLDSLADAEDAGFSRAAFGQQVWRDEPGAKLTRQRIRAWATLAAADADPPQMLISTSPTVIETLRDRYGDTLRLEKLADLSLSLPPADAPPLLGGLLNELATREDPQSVDLSKMVSPAGDAITGGSISARIFVATHRTPAIVIKQMAGETATSLEKDGRLHPFQHTPIVLLEC